MKIKTILIVEDEPDISALVSIILKKSGFVVLQAENGLDALKIARKTIPDLIISDIMMPKMNGLELLKQLKKEESYQNIPVILLTQRDTFDEVQEAYQLGVTYFLPKPFDKDVLLHTIQEIVATI